MIRTGLTPTAWGQSRGHFTAVLDEAVGHHDMGVNDVHVDEAFNLDLGLKE